MGEQIAVPNGAKLIGVRGSGVSVRVGLVVSIGAMMANIDDSSDRESGELYRLNAITTRKGRKLWRFRGKRRTCRRPPPIR